MAGPDQQEGTALQEPYNSAKLHGLSATAAQESHSSTTDRDGEDRRTLPRYQAPSGRHAHNSQSTTPVLPLIWHPTGKALMATAPILPKPLSAGSKVPSTAKGANKALPTSGGICPTAAMGRAQRMASWVGGQHNHGSQPSWGIQDALAWAAGSCPALGMEVGGALQHKPWARPLGDVHYISATPSSLAARAELAQWVHLLH